MNEFIVFFFIFYFLIRLYLLERKMESVLKCSEQAYMQAHKNEMCITEIEMWRNSTAAKTPGFRTIVESYFNQKPSSSVDGKAEKGSLDTRQG